MTITSAKIGYAVVISAIILAAVPAISQTVGVNAAVRNTVTMKAAGAKDSRKAVVKDRVAMGEFIAAEKASALQVLLLDKTTLTVGPNAKMRVDKFIFDPDRKASAVAVSVAKGAFRFVSGKAIQRNPGQSSINTPVGSIGIRGTIVEGFVGPDAATLAVQEGWNLNGAKLNSHKASLIVLRGPGMNAKSGEHPGGIDVTAGGKTVSLDGSGLAVIIPGMGMAPVGPFLLSANGYAAFDKMLRTTPTLAAPAAAKTDTKPDRGHNLAIAVAAAAAITGIAVASSNGRPKSP